MELARYMVDAVMLEGRSYREVARAHGVSKSWVGKLVGWFHQGGYGAIGPRSRAAKTIPHRTAADVEDEVPNERWQSDVTHWRLADGSEAKIVNFIDDHSPRPWGARTELLALGIAYRHSRPYHPQTCGKVERFHQTMKRFLAAQPEVRRSLGSRPRSIGSSPTTRRCGPTEGSVGRPPRQPSRHGTGPGQRGPRSWSERG